LNKTENNLERISQRAETSLEQRCQTVKTNLDRDQTVRNNVEAIRGRIKTTLE
jgi:hypothetical protein